MASITEIWSAAAAVLGAIGGGAAIVFALSSWLGKVWALRIAETERARFAKDLEPSRRSSANWLPIAATR